MKSFKFYYSIVLEELSDRILIHVLDSIEAELKSGETRPELLQQLIDTNRDLMAKALTEAVETGVAPLLHLHGKSIEQGVGNIVEKALRNTKEISSLLHLFPIVGKRIEHQIGDIANSLGQQIARELLLPNYDQYQAATSPQPVVANIAQTVSTLNIDSPHLEALSKSILFSSIDLIRQQVAVQQWKVAHPKHPHATTIM